ncbi:MAG: bacteriohemerythrin [Flavobacteriales bacterium]|nr:MAG: bacteriohemerythrin [Flavobacteriales bacterium]
MSLIWKDEYSVGNAELDAQHRKLMEICNRAQACLEHSAKGDLHLILNELAEYAKYHFRTEERLLEECGCPLLDSQQKEHLAYEGQLVELMLEAMSGVPDKLAIHRHVNDWWLHHILGSDQQYASYLK